MKQSDKHLIIEAESKDELYTIKEPIDAKEKIMQLYDFNLPRLIDHVKIENNLLLLYMPDSKDESKFLKYVRKLKNHSINRKSKALSNLEKPLTLPELKRILNPSIMVGGSSGAYTSRN